MTDDLVPKKKKSISDRSLLSIEAAINLIPVAGGFLGTYFGEIRGKRMQERMIAYFKYFSKKVEELEKNKIDMNYFKSEEFAELLVQGAEQAAKSSGTTRIRRFANILANNITFDAKSRSRTQSIMSFVDRLSDIDAFVLISYGDPHGSSLRADTKDQAFQFVKSLADFIEVDVPKMDVVIESIIYLDNLGITWVNETPSGSDAEKGESLLLKEFSSFRTPLGNEVAKVIAPPTFFLLKTGKEKRDWPKDFINPQFKDDLFF